MLEKLFDENNRVKTYRKSVKCGFLLGPILFTSILLLNRDVIHENGFFLNFAMKPLFAYGLFFVAIFIYRPLSRAYRLKNKEARNTVTRGLIEAAIRFVGALGLTYYFSIIAFILIERYF